MIHIQYQDQSGSWTDAMVVDNNDWSIVNGMRQVKSWYPTFRVRAITDNGILVDIL